MRLLGGLGRREQTDNQKRAKIELFSDAEQRTYRETESDQLESLIPSRLSVRHQILQPLLSTILHPVHLTVLKCAQISS